MERNEIKLMKKQALIWWIVTLIVDPIGLLLFASTLAFAITIPFPIEQIPNITSVIITVSCFGSFLIIGFSKSLLIDKKIKKIYDIVLEKSWNNVDLDHEKHNLVWESNLSHSNNVDRTIKQKRPAISKIFKFLKKIEHGLDY
ncbi:MAG: hypothetical protein ACRC4L_00335 [Mycoplasma sp.]